MEELASRAALAAPLLKEVAELRRASGVNALPGTAASDTAAAAASCATGIALAATAAASVSASVAATAAAAAAAAAALATAIAATAVSLPVLQLRALGEPPTRQRVAFAWRWDHGAGRTSEGHYGAAAGRHGRHAEFPCAKRNPLLLWQQVQVFIPPLGCLFSFFLSFFRSSSTGRAAAGCRAAWRAA